MNRKFAFAAVIATAVAAPVFAQTNTNNIDQRQVTQDRRIEQGEQSGSLTPHETKKLEKGEGHINKMESKAESDGKVTKKEKKHIEKAENKESHEIRHQKHDAQHE